MSENKFERFGKYLILDHLVDGGMAKICRARYLGEQANKIVAIKMVQAQFSKDPAFVQMFEDELKVTFGLLHPNIAQMYDYGIINSQLYTAMEYVDGANLKQYLDRLKEKNFVFPVEISTYITSQVCQALNYAHTFTDQLSGKPFNIVHRDISPHNIMLTYDGAVKVIDFGIAKADSNSEATQAGTIKGKLSYLAPEYLDGLKLDHRYDQFAVGLTLWELLCSRKLFQANNDLAVLKQIQACKIPPPSSINPNVPKELDHIVLKSMSKDRNQRYEDMDKFNRALIKFLYSQYPDFNATDLGYFAKQLFKEEIANDKKKFVEYGKIDITQHLKDLADGAPTQSEVTETKRIVGDSTETVKQERIELDFELSEEDVDLAQNLNLNQAAPKKIARPSGSTATGINIKRPTAGTATRRVAKKGTSTRRVAKKGAVKKKQGSSSSLGKIVASFAIIAAVLFTQKDMIKEYTGFDIAALLGGEEQVQTRKLANTPTKEILKNGEIRFLGLDNDMIVSVNGSEQKLNGVSTTADLNKVLKVTISKKGYKKHFFRNIRLDEAQSTVTLQIPNLEKESIGVMSTSKNFTSGSKLILEIAGETVSKDLPFQNFRLPAGVYNAKIANPLLGTQRSVQFEITENKRFYLR